MIDGSSLQLRYVIRCLGPDDRSWCEYIDMRISYMASGQDQYVQLKQKTEQPPVSSLREYILHTIPITWSKSFLYFILGQPLKVGQTKLVVGEVCLAGHDPSFHEKELLSSQFF